MKKVFRLLIIVCFLFGASAVTAEEPETDTSINVKFIGHASFLITMPDGTRLITDPYRSPRGFPRGIEADIVTMSHFHDDHSTQEFVKGEKELVYARSEDGVTESQEFGELVITGYGSYHHDK